MPEQRGNDWRKRILSLASSQIAEHLDGSNRRRGINARCFCRRIFDAGQYLEAAPRGSSAASRRLKGTRDMATNGCGQECRFGDAIADNAMTVRGRFPFRGRQL